MQTLASLDLRHQRVLIREDFNVPVENGRITSDARIQAAIPTLKLVLEKGGYPIVMSHFGRPEEGQFDVNFSLKIVAEALAKIMQVDVRFVSDPFAPFETKENQIIFLENVRFLKGEASNDPLLAAKLAKLADIMVMDAFATAHRAQASTEGVIHKAKKACAGPLLTQEVEALTTALLKPTVPLVALVGGSKVSSKMAVLENLLLRANALVIGGGMANTFLAAQGYAVGKSLVEPDYIETAKRILHTAAQRKIAVHLPVDVIVAEKVDAAAPTQEKSVSLIAQNDIVLDIGSQTCKIYAEVIKNAGTLIWNGPVGMFELPNFRLGTMAVAKAVAASPAYSLAGGGDTIAAIEMANVADKINYISTAGGAFLEFVEGKTLPAIAALHARANN